MFIPEIPMKEIKVEEHTHEKSDNIIVKLIHRPTQMSVSNHGLRVARGALIYSLKRELEQKVFKYKIATGRR